MNPEQKQFLSLAILPARVTPAEAALLLGCNEHDIPILVAANLLKPLGNPPPNGSKYFATADLEEIKTDRKWLTRATDAIHNHWRKKNARKSDSAAR